MRQIFSATDIGGSLIPQMKLYQYDGAGGGATSTITYTEIVPVLKF